MDVETLDEDNSFNQSTVIGSERASLNNPIQMSDIGDDNEKRADLLVTKKDFVYGTSIKDPNPSRLGKTLSFWYIKKNPLITIGPHCKHNLYLLDPLALVLLVMMTSIFLAEQIYIYPKMANVFCTISMLLYFTQILSHLITALVNPGIPSREHYIPTYVKIKALNLSVKNEGYKVCKVCNICIHSRKNVSHCSDCEVCVEGNNRVFKGLEMDHHCPWTGKCIGRINMYPFYVFVFSTLLFILYSFVTLIMYFVTMLDVPVKTNKTL